LTAKWEDSAKSGKKVEIPRKSNVFHDFDSISVKAFLCQQGVFSEALHYKRRKGCPVAKQSEHWVEIALNLDFSRVWEIMKIGF
jgi:hypothetical protein